MRNLLSEQDKNAIRKEYRLRVIVTFLIFSFFTVVLAVMFLLPSYFISNTKVNNAQGHSDIVQKSIAIREQNTSNTILLQTQKKLEFLTQSQQGTSLSFVFAKIIESKPDNVKIEGFYYEGRVGDKQEIVITGIAQQRESLLSFKRAIGREVLFETVVLPVSNLAADRDIQFSIRVSGKF